MYQRSSSSTKGVHRGSQQKRIRRQQLQSSSSRTASTAAAVAAAGAESAWRGLDRISRACRQTIDRGLQLGAMSGWPDECDVVGTETPNERQFHCRQGAQAWKCVVSETSMRIWVVGLDAVGETTMIGRLRISPCGTWKARMRSNPCDADDGSSCWRLAAFMRISPLGRSRITRGPTVSMIATVALVVRRRCLQILDSYGSFFIMNNQSLLDGVGRKQGVSNVKGCQHRR